MKACVFDIETSPQLNLLPLALEAARQRDAARRHTTGLEAKDSSPTRLEGEIAKEMALSGVWGRVVGVGLLDVDGGAPRVWCGEDERELLAEFWEAVRGVKLFIGYNSMTFDVPFLELRSRILGVEIPVEISQRRFYVYNHIDLYEAITAWKGNRLRYLKLDLSTVCKALGVVPPQGSGSEVPALYQTGDFAAIRKHLEYDLQATLAVWQQLGCPGRRDGG